MAVLLNHKVRLTGVAFLGAVVATTITDRAGGDVVVAAALKATRGRHGRAGAASGPRGAAEMSTVVRGRIMGRAPPLEILV